EVLSWKFAGPDNTKQSVPDSLLFYGDPSAINYQWSGPNGFSSTEAQPSVNDLGRYYVTVSNADTSLSDSLELVYYPDPVLEAKGAWLSCGEDSVMMSHSLAFGTHQPGLEYEYYSGNWNSLPDFDALNPLFTGLSEGFSLDDRQADDYFAFVYTGQILIDSAGTYTFYTNSDDGSKLWINDSLIVNNDGTHGMRERSGTVALTGGYHDIEVRFFERNGGANLIVSYAGPGISKTVIPDEKLVHQSEDQYSYLWTGPNGYQDTREEAFAREAGTYYLTITDNTTKCSSTDTAIIVTYCADYQGRIFEDENENTVFDQGETAFDSVFVELLDEYGMLLDSARTDSSGGFLFATVNPGNYYFRFSNFPNEFSLLSGQSGFIQRERGGQKSITSSLQAVSAGSSGNIAVPIRREAQLPVEFLEFQATVVNESIQLNWITAWEQNNERFVIERSLDGRVFGIIGEVMSTGDSQSPQSYQFEDPDRHLAHMIDRWYYRLRQVDFDGQFSFSSVVLASMEAGEIPLEISAYPNPLDGPELTIRYSGSDQNTSLQLSVVNALGKVLYESTLSTAQDQELRISVDQWPAGYYYLRLEGTDQQKVFKVFKP
ncbi:MAG: PA14 domain-containing protein, partial [Bacteroidota bacterium]